MFGFDAMLQPEFVLRLCPVLVPFPFVNEGLYSLAGSCCKWCCLGGYPDGSWVEVLPCGASVVSLAVHDDSAWWALLFPVRSNLVGVECWGGGGACVCDWVEGDS